VSPDGALRETEHTLLLKRCSATELEAEAAQAGLAPIGRRGIDETPDHVGSVVVLLERAR
jgi:hypothetical protein